MFNESTNRRKPAFAESFYPATKEAIIAHLHKLEREVQNNKEIQANVPAQPVSGLIVPHAGWIYSGKTAMAAYQLLKTHQPKNIILLGPAHRTAVQTAVRDNHAFWETPLGNTSIIQDKDFEVFNPAHANEHSLEVQLPFIQFFAPKSKILPLVIGTLTEEEVIRLASKLREKDYFLIVSTDLSHFHPLAEAQRRDVATIQNIEACDENKLEACGFHALRIAFAHLRPQNRCPHLIHYSTSAEAFGDTTSVVGYASFWI